MDKQASVFVRDDRFVPETPPPGEFLPGLNGIVCHPGGYLLVGKSGTGRVFKVMLDSRAITEVRITDQNGELAGLTSLDGLYLHPKGENLISTGRKGIFSAYSSDSWLNAVIIDSYSPNPAGFVTTGTFRDQEQLYVLHAHLDQLQSKPDYDPFQLESVDIKYGPPMNDKSYGLIIAMLALAAVVLSGCVYLCRRFQNKSVPDFRTFREHKRGFEDTGAYSPPVIDGQRAYPLQERTKSAVRPNTSQYQPV
jgi:hypothetical protein